MDEPKGSFKWFIHQMSEVVFNLLGSLNVYQLQDDTCEKVNIFVIHLIGLLSLLDF